MMYDTPEDPRLSRLERTGYPDGGPELLGRCPYCDSEIYAGDIIYKIDGVGKRCENCVSEVYAEDEYGW